MVSLSPDFLAYVRDVSCMRRSEQVQLESGYLESWSHSDRDDQGETSLLGNAPHEGCEFSPPSPYRC